MTRLLAVTAALLVVVLGMTAVSVAGDRSVSVGFEPESTTVEQGETVELAVITTTEGGHADQGIADSTVRLDYPADQLDVVELEHGPMLKEGEAPLEVDRRVNNSAGVAELDQTLVEAREGVVGTGTIAFVTFEVDPDAPDAVLQLEAGNSEFQFVATAIPIPVFAPGGELVVGDGGETIEPDEPDTVTFEDGDDLSTANDTGSGTDEPADGDTTAQGGDDSETEADDTTDEDVDGFGPGFSAVGALVAVGGVVAWAFRRP